MTTTGFYPEIAALREDDVALRDCVASTVRKLAAENTSTSRPGILLGKIQSGKTRAFLGVIAEAFDNDYEIAVVLTKGTVSLARQTLNRIRSDFRPFIEQDEVQVYDIMTLPDLTPYELNQHLILVVK